MTYKLRFVQNFVLRYSKEYLELEKEFEKFEKMHPEAPKGRRYLALTGRDPSNTLIWECDFDTLEEAQKAQAFFLTDTRHEDLYQQQSQYILGTYTEIYRPFS